MTLRAVSAPPRTAEAQSGTYPRLPSSNLGEGAGESSDESSVARAAAFAVHDAKNKLASMRLNLTYLQSLARERALDAAVTETLADLAECNEELEGLLSEALLASKGVAPPKSRAPLQLSNLAVAAASHVRTAAQAKWLAVLVRGGHDCAVWADRAQLMRVLDNLLDNAIRYSPANSVIEIGYEHDGNIARITVSDQGPGVAAENTMAVFEEGFTTEAERAARGANAGLGLAYCRRVVEEHGGRVFVRNNEGGGATFYVELVTASRDA